MMKKLVSLFVFVCLFTILNSNANSVDFWFLNSTNPPENKNIDSTGCNLSMEILSQVDLSKIVLDKQSFSSKNQIKKEIQKKIDEINDAFYKDMIISGYRDNLEKKAGHSSMWQQIKEHHQQIWDGIAKDHQQTWDDIAKHHQQIQDGIAKRHQQIWDDINKKHHQNWGIEAVKTDQHEKKIPKSCKKNGKYFLILLKIENPEITKN